MDDEEWNGKMEGRWKGGRGGGQRVGGREGYRTGTEDEKGRRCRIRKQRRTSEGIRKQNQDPEME